MPDDAPPPRDEFVLRVLLSLRSGRGAALDTLIRQRSALTKLLQLRRREARAAGVGGDLPATLAAEVLVARAEADLRWLDACEARLSRLPDGEELTDDPRGNGGTR